MCSPRRARSGPDAGFHRPPASHAARTRIDPPFPYRLRRPLPDRLQQLALAEDPPLLAHQADQQIELTRGQGQWRIRLPCAAPEWIDTQIRIRQQVARSRSAPKVRHQPRLEFVHGKGLGEVIVGPALQRHDLVPSSVLAVSIRTGTCVRLRMSGRSARPSMSGMARSSTMASGRRCAMRANASRPLAAVSTSNPRKRSATSTARRRLGSSSTTRMRGSAAWGASAVPAKPKPTSRSASSRLSGFLPISLSRLAVSDPGQSWRYDDEEAEYGDPDAGFGRSTGVGRQDTGVSGSGWRQAKARRMDKASLSARGGQRDRHGLLPRRRWTYPSQIGYRNRGWPWRRGGRRRGGRKGTGRRPWAGRRGWRRPATHGNTPVSGAIGSGTATGTGAAIGKGQASGTGTVYYRGEDGRIHRKSGTGSVAGRGVAIGDGSVRARPPYEAKARPMAMASSGLDSQTRGARSSDWGDHVAGCYPNVIT